MRIFILVCFFIMFSNHGLCENVNFKKLKRLQNQLNRVSSMIFVVFCNRNWDSSSRINELANKLQSRFIYLRQEMSKFNLSQRACPKVYKPVKGLFGFSIINSQANKKYGQCNIKEVSSKCNLLIESDGPGGLIRPGRFFSRQ